MKILGYGIYQDHALGGDILLAKGLRSNGCTVDTYDFKQQVKQYGQVAADNALLSMAGHYDLLLIGKGERLNPKLAEKLAAQLPLALWYGDIRNEIPGYLMAILPFVDYFFMTSGGETLKQYHRLGVKNVSAYLFNPFDPDLICSDAVTEKSLDVLFTGTGYRFAGDERKASLDYLKQRSDVTFFGGAEKFTAAKFSLWQKLKKELSRLNKRRKVRGEAYFDVIQRAKIGIGVNAVHHINKYTSDRLTHYTGFGTFFLAHEFDGLRELFTADEVVSFNTIEQLDSLITHYLHNPAEREAIAKNAQQKVLQHYNCHNITGMMLDIINRGSSDRFPWLDIVR
ncbi:glycosyltransferase [Rheinheimera sp.]|uniref:glycosyltransferase family protein n=1 Tax=Rheinheimera sp. TaxID=1869214 RepID=UPI002732DC40|nr:glycosyltransferase [Rheinheimera sp.]MDP2716813.1 glycosyltransferase [Rheinheimera sp.]